METMTMQSKHSRPLSATFSKIAAAAAFGLLLSGFVSSARADAHHDDRDRGHAEHHEYRGRGHDRGPAVVYNDPDYYYVPAPDYYYQPDPYAYDYPPEPEYYPPAPSEGINLFFGL